MIDGVPMLLGVHLQAPQPELEDRPVTFFDGQVARDAIERLAAQFGRVGVLARGLLPRIDGRETDHALRKHALDLRDVVVADVRVPVGCAVACALVHLEHGLKIDAALVHPGDQDFLGNEGAGGADTHMKMRIENRPGRIGCHPETVSLLLLWRATGSQLRGRRASALIGVYSSGQSVATPSTDTGT